MGLHRPGRLMRQAFSLGDLTLLQPPSENYDTDTWSPSGSSLHAPAMRWREPELPETSNASTLSPHHL